MSNKLATIGLVTFLACDIVLVALALQPGRFAGESPEAESTVAVTTTARPASTPTSSGSASARPAQGPKPSPVNITMGALDGRTAWRAATGTCAQGGSAIAVTDDGGKTWAKTKSPSRALARVQPLDAVRVFTIGAGEDCVLKQFPSNDRGDSWQEPTAISGGWARQLDKATDVLTPQDDRAQPCGASTAVIDLSRTSASQAQVLCADGDVKLTDDGGDTWNDSGSVVGGLALGNRLEGSRLATYVGRVGGGCSGIQLVRVAKGKKVENVACVGSNVPSKPGQVALSVVAGAGWMAVADRVWTAGSTDLTTWKQP